MPDQPTDPRWLSPEKRAKMRWTSDICKDFSQAANEISVLLDALDLADELAAKQAGDGELLEAIIDTIPVDVMLAVGPPFNVRFSPSAFDLIVKAHRKVGK